MKRHPISLIFLIIISGLLSLSCEKESVQPEAVTGQGIEGVWQEIYTADPDSPAEYPGSLMAQLSTYMITSIDKKAVLTIDGGTFSIDHEVAYVESGSAVYKRSTILTGDVALHNNILILTDSDGTIEEYVVEMGSNYIDLLFGPYSENCTCLYSNPTLVAIPWGNDVSKYHGRFVRQ